MAANPDAVVDTNVVIRYLMRDVPAQFDAIEAWFERVRSGKEKVLLLESVLVECIYVLTKYYQVPKAETAEVLLGLLGYKGLINSDRDVLATALGIFAETALDPVDCLVLARARRDRLRVVSFDKALLRLSPTDKG